MTPSGPASRTNGHRFEISVRGPFDLARSARFLETWAPATGTPTGGTDAAPTISYAFCSETDWEPLGVTLTATAAAPATGRVDVTVTRAAGPEVRDEIARTFSLDVDGTAFAEVGRRDPVIGALQEQRPGLRPVCFWSTWEAASWAILVQRTSMVHAARAKSRMARELGEVVTVDGRELPVFPSPVRLLEQRAKVEIPVVKRTWLCGLAEAALEGALDAGFLRSLDGEAAQAELQRLDGVGPFSAALIASRGAGHPDLFTAAEPRLAKRMDEAYRTGSSARAAAAIADRWRPFRTWCSFLLRSAGEDDLAAAARSLRA